MIIGIFFSPPCKRTPMAVGFTLYEFTFQTLAPTTPAKKCIFEGKKYFNAKKNPRVKYINKR